MEKKHNPMNNTEMISMLEQLRRDIDTDIDKRKFTYRGKDGKDYFDKESLDVANRIYEETMNSKIYKDSKYYNEPDIPKDSIYYNDPDISSKTR